MNIVESIGTAFKNVFSNKLRTFLTTLGIIIGIASVIIITFIGEGSKVKLEEQFEAMGFGQLNVFLSNYNDISDKDLLSQADVDILAELPGVKWSAGKYELWWNAQLKLLNPRESKEVFFSGVTPEYREVNKDKIIYGRYINKKDVESASKVAIIKDTTALKVFGKADTSVLNQKISIKTHMGTQKFSVVGIIENSQAEMEMMFGGEYPEDVIVPLSALQRLAGTKEINSLYIAVTEKDKMTETAALVSSVLDEFHGTQGNYYVQDPTDFMSYQNEAQDRNTAFIACVAGISLLVGGIGIMNIMLVTVTERTREIGIRKSIGARNQDILLQFLIESVVLTALGGFLGIVAGYAGANIVGNFVDIPPVVSFPAVIVAVMSSCFIGVVFGVGPANKAAKLDPIEALRYE